MKAIDIPGKFNVAFGSSAGGSFIRPIPQASQIGIENGAASLVTGFPPLNFTPISSGGVPPFGQDFNGILKQITQWNQWQSAGNALPWDSAFSAAISGYPKGAVVASSSIGTFWLSLVDDNVTNPDTGGAGWERIGRRPVVPVSSNQSPVLKDYQSDYMVSGARTFTLPLANTLFNGFSFSIYASTGDVTVTPNAADRIVMNLLGTGASYVVPLGKTAKFTTDAGTTPGQWFVSLASSAVATGDVWFRSGGLFITRNLISFSGIAATSGTINVDTLYPNLIPDYAKSLILTVETGYSADPINGACLLSVMPQGYNLSSVLDRAKVHMLIANSTAIGVTAMDVRMPVAPGAHSFFWVLQATDSAVANKSALIDLWGYGT